MNTGDTAPDFTLPDEGGDERSLTSFLSAGPVVAYFYPAAMTSGCTAESCRFRDLGEEFRALGANRVGISPDGVDKQARFATANNFDFPLLSDSDGSVARRFGVRRRFGPLVTKRHTFVIDTDRTVLTVIRSEVRMGVHAEHALRALRARQ